MSTYEPPAWVKSESASYKRWLNKKANSVMKRDRKRGGTYCVKEAMDAIHQAMHSSDGIDPYDGMAMNSELMGAYNNADSKARGAAYKRDFYRLPTIDHRNAKPVCDFEIVSWQTNDAKGDMNPEEYLKHCRAVVDHCKVSSSNSPTD